jgi:TonB-dependent siderophore receptor
MNNFAESNTIRHAGGRRRRISGLASTCAIALAAALATMPATAETARAETVAAQSFEIPSGNLGAALRVFAEQSHIQLFYAANIAEQRQSPGVHGNMSPEQALVKILAGTGLQYRFNDATTVTLSEPVSAADGERVLGPVMVQGAAGSGLAGSTAVNGINGSRDVTATEGTGSFTSDALSLGAKRPVPLKDVPQSVSVLTAQRMEEQAVTSLSDALSRSTGVTLVQGDDSTQNVFYSRGFQITSIQIDGGAPLNTRRSAFGYNPQIDMAQFDHVELLRGAAGTFNLYGDPSGTINLTRKKPLDHNQFTFEGQLASWQNYRVVADATGPLGLGGRLRGRAVMSYQNNDYFYRYAHDERLMLYGITEFDLTDSTLVTAGISYTTQNGKPFASGIPRYADGTDAHLPRDTSFVLPWNRSSLKTTEIFGSVEQQIGADWNAKLNLTHIRQRSEQKIGGASGLINPYIPGTVTLGGSLTEDGSNQTSGEFTVSGKFRFLGHDQRLLVGANYVQADGSFLRYHSALTFPTSDGRAPVIDVFNFNPNDPSYAEPGNSLLYSGYPERRQITMGAYANLVLTPIDRLHINVGWRYSRIISRKRINYYCSDDLFSQFVCEDEGLSLGDVYDSSFERYKNQNFSWPPSVSALYDLTKNLTVYAGYTDIYVDQSYYVDRDLKAIGPITGGNYEIGTKWQSPDKKLSATLSAYYIKQNGVAIIDPTSKIDDFTYVDNKGNEYSFGQLGDGVSCCYLGNADLSRISKGFDFEIAGALSKKWQVSLGYTFNDNYITGKDVATLFLGTAGNPLVSEQPKHLVKLWTSYQFAKSRWWKNLGLGFGVQGQSSVYRTASTCTQLDTTGRRTCVAGATKTIAYTQPGYAIASARIDYSMSDHWSLALNIDNIFDKSYYQTIGAATSGSSNWYGEPRSFTLTLRGKW